MASEHDEPIPDVIPRVELDKNGEPVLVTHQVIEPSPIPRLLTIVILLLLVANAGYTVFQQEQRNDDVARIEQLDRSQNERIEQLLISHQAQIDQSNQERERLRQLIIATAEATSQEERDALLRAYAAAERQALQDTPP